MPATVVIGAQWGDEGKGKVIDVLARGGEWKMLSEDDAEMVVRYQGGDNAGHTIVVGDEIYKLNLIPSGVLHPHVTPVIGNGVVINPQRLIEEIDDLEARGISVAKLRVSQNAHLVMPYHLQLDAVTERFLGKNKLGTTKRGIGPAFADKATRLGLRVQDLLDPKIFEEKLEVVLWEKNQLLSKVYNRLPLKPKDLLKEYMGYAERMKPYIGDTAVEINQALREGKHVLLEGAQATLLDLDHGTYPYVTSSNPVAGGACVGAGVSPREITRIIGIAKAYVTRVGSGPFPSEMPDDIADELRAKAGDELGVRTGRVRRVGWFDSVLLRYADMLNGFTELVITKLDMLHGYAQIPVCTAYEYEGQTYREFPHQSVFNKCEPVYTQLAGWSDDFSKASSWAELPVEARKYVEFLQEQVGVPIRLVGVGRERSQIFRLAS